MDLDPKVVAWILVLARVFIAFGGVLTAAGSDGLATMDWLAASLAGMTALEAALSKRPQDARDADARTRETDRP